MEAADRAGRTVLFIVSAFFAVVVASFSLRQLSGRFAVITLDFTKLVACGVAR